MKDFHALAQFHRYSSPREACPVDASTTVPKPGAAAGTPIETVICTFAMYAKVQYARFLAPNNSAFAELIIPLLTT